MSETHTIIEELKSFATEEKRLFLPYFFKTGKGQYGEGDVFLGVTVPYTRKVAKAHKDTSMDTISGLLASEYHEARLCALLIMVRMFAKGDEETRQRVFDFYLGNTARINNWDLVDLSAPYIVGKYLLDKPRDILYELSESNLLWDNRIAIVSTLAFIRNNDLDDTYALAQKLMTHKHDLIHKATGWMLREAGKRDPRILYDFIDSRHTTIPRTMLRYAIEKFSQEERKYLMRKE
ncbi:DNA alkylation repair protein [Xylanibacter muris]|uniref:DNA alkylation repair protein n=1 Tax=Xylanibacter muris TaxID=2736290 RepID=A0ABX2AMX7_9BACT|nr:DNA alkylation repair protein [Xylanibacter muris]NPD91286.1 DNA alkylation repair protein [Xylanibacter muris]